MKYAGQRKSFNCPFCDKQLESQAGQNGHVPYCKMNPNKKEAWNKGKNKENCAIMRKMADKIKATQNDPEWINTVGKRKAGRITIAKKNNPTPSWNKGQTKENSEKLQAIGQKISQAYKNTSSEEKEKRRRQARTKTLERIAEHPYSRFHNTKPERAMKEFLEYLGIAYKQNYPVFNIPHAYPADFFLPKYNMIIEVDGKHWHNFPMLNKMDLIRTSELQQTGYSVFRIWEDIIPVLWDMPDAFLEHLENCRLSQ